MVVGRGGGSLEDLWAFNEERVARAIFASEIPIISAVGHQIDFTISDFVADLRAPTPSAAAQMVVKDKENLLKEIKSIAQRLISYQTSLIEYSKQRLKSAQQSYGFRRPLDLITQRWQRVDEFTRQLRDKIKNYFEFRKNDLSLRAEKLETLSPHAVLKRGYSITRKLPELEIIKDASLLKKEDRLEVKFFKGKVKSKVEQIDPE
jgi:exodeoxyribonuclease VII large subunit